MTETEWRGRIAEIELALQNSPESSEPQDRLEYALSLLWSAMQARPPEVRYAYQRLTEPEITAIAAPRVNSLGLKAPAAWAPGHALSMPDLVLAVAAEIRALDEALDQARDRGPRGVDPNEDWLAWGGEPVFIAPRPVWARAVPRRGQDFDRRGLLYNRILPKAVEGIPIRFYMPALSGPGSQGDDAEAVSAIYRSVQLNAARNSENTEFWIDGVMNLAEIATDLDEQLNDLFAGAPAMAIVWPELCMPPELLNRLTTQLESRSLDPKPPQFGFVVAGSWHEDRVGGRVNVARVLDRHGQQLLEVTKREAFEIEAGVLEAITPGNELSILVYGELLIAFGICKDFCERRWTPAYRALDVDYVIAPSFGTATTMDEHKSAARSLTVGYGTRSFVVQQMLEAPWGMVLGPAERPRGTAAPILQNNLLVRTTVSCTIP